MMTLTAVLIFLAFALIPALFAALPGWLAYRREKKANREALAELEALKRQAIREATAWRQFDKALGIVFDDEKTK